MMLKLLKRYRAFVLLLLVNVGIGLWMPDIGLKSLDITRQNVIEMISVIPPIFILLGLLDVWVDRATMMKYTGKNSGIRGVLLSFLLGAAAAGPLYAAFPVAGVMIRKGSSLFNVFIFIGAWSTLKIPMLTFEAASLGLEFTMTRMALSIVGVGLIAWITERSLNREQQKAIVDLNQANDVKAK